MNWLHVPSTESCHNITVSDHMKIYQFAISANSKNSMTNVFSDVYGPTTSSSSSGMVWASCTVLHNKSMWIRAKVQFFFFFLYKQTFSPVFSRYRFVFVYRRRKNKKRLGERYWLDVHGAHVETRLFRKDRCCSRIPDILLSRGVHQQFSL